MAGKLTVLILGSTALVAASLSSAEARAGSNGGTNLSGPAAHGSVQSHGRQKIKTLRGKRNPSDQGREH
jgi:hypothetical protein